MPTVPAGWRELEVRAPAAEEERVVAALDLAGSRGSWTPAAGVVRGYFDADEAAPDVAFRRAWAALAGDPDRFDLRLVDVPPTDWTAPYRAAARPVAATARLWVAPPDAAAPEEGWPAAAVVVRIQPGAGFGTGGHATTRALLAWLDSEPGADTVLDVGTGSGVLAIAAALLGTRHAVGLDPDLDALANAAENRRSNRVENRVALVAGTVDALRGDARFDRVLANLDAATLDRLLPDLASACAQGGRVGVAGLLAAERDACLDRARAAGLVLLDERTEPDPALGDAWWSGWLAPVAVTPSATSR